MFEPFLASAELVDRVLRGARGEVSAHFRAGVASRLGPVLLGRQELSGFHDRFEPACAANALGCWLRGRSTRWAMPRVPDGAALIGQQSWNQMAAESL
jgi:hypothetical protein